MEQNENNNLWVGSICIQNAKVDLTVDNFSMNNSDTLHAGDLLKISVNFKNNGPDNIHNAFYEYYLSVDTIFDINDTKTDYLNYILFDWNSIRTENISLAIPSLSLLSKYYLFVRIHTKGQEITINDYNLNNNIILLDSIIVIDQIKNNTLNFDDLFGATSWSEDGYIWKWDNSGMDNIRNYFPHTGSGHAMSIAGNSSRLSTSSLLNIEGLWIKTENAFNFSYLRVLGYNKENIVIYSKSLNANDYQSNYVYTPLKWDDVKSIQFDFEIWDKGIPTTLFYDDMEYTYLNDTVSVNIKIENQVITRVYPNPGNGIFKIFNSDGFENVTVKIYNINGQVVFEKTGFSGDNLSVDISQKPDGLYLMELIKDSSKRMIKIIKN